MVDGNLAPAKTKQRAQFLFSLLWLLTELVHTTYPNLPTAISKIHVFLQKRPFVTFHLTFFQNGGWKKSQSPSHPV